MKSSQARAAPKAISPRAATLVSRSRKTGKPSLAPSSAAIGTSLNPGPMLGVCRTTPRQGSTGPGLEMPIPTSAERISSGTCSRAQTRAASQASRMAPGPSAIGVRTLVRASRDPSSRTTAARTCVPPTSSARTGRADRGKPSNLDMVRRLDNSSKGDSATSGPVGPFGSSGKARVTGPGIPSRWGIWLPEGLRRGHAVAPQRRRALPNAQAVLRSRRRWPKNIATPAGAGVAIGIAAPIRSGADPEDLAAAVRADALGRRLAILHGDLLGVLDHDLLLVLDAIALGHGS